MTPGEWIAFAALMLSTLGGGVSTAIWIVIRLEGVRTEVRLLKQRIDLFLPDAGGNIDPRLRAFKLETGGRNRPL